MNATKSASAGKKSNKKGTMNQNERLANWSWKRLKYPIIKSVSTARKK